MVQTDLNENSNMVKVLHKSMSKLETVKINEVKQETPTIKSFYLDKEIDAKPGQFVMLWVPGVDEFPVALSRIHGKCSLTVKAIGKGTEALHRMTAGDTLGIRGPYGNGYTLDERDTLVVIGGYGGASILPAVDELNRQGVNVKVALGAACDEELLFADELSLISDVALCTDDGSVGKHCMVTELAMGMFDDVEQVLTCGPEKMMKKTVDICMERGIPVQASLERYMKCGMGLCDSCSIDGLQVCVDGPVFTGEQLSKVNEFGKFERDPTGRRTSI